MPRYKIKREYIDWDWSEEIQIAKMLAGAIKKNEAVGKYDLWQRFDILYPKIIEILLDKIISFKELRVMVEDSQKKKITPEKLYQRADKTLRYKEYNLFKEAVFFAYDMICKPIPLELDTRRTFTNEEVRIAVSRQNGVCAIPACKAPFTGLNLPVGDHVVPWSQGGRTEQRNCAALCVRCNSQKDDMSMLEFCSKLAVTNSRGRKRIMETK